MQPAPFSPPLSETKQGNIYEFRTYTYQPGTMPKVLEAFSKVIPERAKLSPLVGIWVSAIGPLNQFIHVWAYRDSGERERIRAEASKKGRRLAAGNQAVHGDAGKHVDDSVSMRTFQIGAASRINRGLPDAVIGR